jgi:hypothetical protein
VGKETLGNEAPTAIANGWIVIIMPPPPSLPVRWLSLTAAPEVLRDRQKLPGCFTCFTKPISRFSRLEFSTMLTSERHAVGHSLPAPMFR